MLYDRSKERAPQKLRRRQGSEARRLVCALQRILETSSFDVKRLAAVVAALAAEHFVLKAFAAENDRVPVRLKDSDGSERIVLRRVRRVH